MRYIYFRIGSHLGFRSVNMFECSHEGGVEPEKGYRIGRSVLCCHSFIKPPFSIGPSTMFRRSYQCTGGMTSISLVSRRPPSARHEYCNYMPRHPLPKLFNGYKMIIGCHKHYFKYAGLPLDWPTTYTHRNWSQRGLVVPALLGQGHASGGADLTHRDRVSGSRVLQI